MDLPLNPEFPYYLVEDDFVEMSGRSQDDGIDWSRLLAFAREIQVAAGEPLIRQFEHDATIYVLTHGEFEVRIAPSPSAPSLPIATIEPIAVIGEQSFLDDGPRTATVVALKRSSVFQLTREALENLRREEPRLAWAFLMDIARSLSGRSRALLARQASL